MIKAIIFDWGGVLAPDNNAIVAKKLSNKHACNEIELYRKLDSYEAEYSAGPQSDEYYLKISKEFNIPPNIVKQELNDVPPKKEMFNIARKLKSMGYRIYVLSDQMKPKTDAIRKLNETKIFNGMFFSNEMGLMKPDEKAFVHVLEKIRTPPSQCVFIDNLKENIKMAKLLKFNTILYRSESDLVKRLRYFSIPIQ